MCGCSTNSCLPTHTTWASGGALAIRSSHHGVVMFPIRTSSASTAKHAEQNFKANVSVAHQMPYAYVHYARRQKLTQTAIEEHSILSATKSGWRPVAVLSAPHDVLTLPTTIPMYIYIHTYVLPFVFLLKFIWVALRSSDLFSSKIQRSILTWFFFTFQCTLLYWTSKALKCYCAFYCCFCCAFM